MMVGVSQAREEIGEKSDPRVRFLVKECAMSFRSQQMISKAWINASKAKTTRGRREVKTCRQTKGAHGPKH
jgi:hypothetical protein